MADPGRTLPAGRPATADSPCAIGLWGTFDTGSLGDRLIARIMRRELATRLPLARIHAAAPMGSRRGDPRDSGDPAGPLGPWSPERSTALGAELDGVVVAGTALFPDPDDLAARYRIDRLTLDELAPDRYFVEGPGRGDGGPPVVWHGVRLEADPTPEQAARLRSVAGSRVPISVSDEGSRRRLQAAGIETEVAVIPDLALLAARLHSPELLAKRLDYLRLMGWYPGGGLPLLIEGDATLLPSVAAIAAAVATLRSDRPGVAVVVAELGSVGDAEFAEALLRVLSEIGLGSATFHLPGAAGIEDACAAIAACGAFVTPSGRNGLIALSHGRPPVVLGWAARGSVDQGAAEPVALVERPADLAGALSRALASQASPARLAGLAKQVDAGLDQLAAFTAPWAQVRRGAHPITDAERVHELEEQLGNLAVAHDVRSRRLAAERMVFANHLRKAEEEIAALKAEAARLRDEVSAAAGRVAQAEAALRSEAAAHAAAEAELIALRSTRTFRYTAELRSAYGRMRKLSPPEQPEQPQHP